MLLIQSHAKSQLYSVMIINQNMSQNILLLAMLVGLCLGIDQNCPCPANSNCLSNGMCACQPGFIGNCSTAAIQVGTTVTTANLTQGGTTLFYINPISLTQFIQFNFQLCNSVPLTLTFTLYGQTGDTTAYNGNNQLGSSTTGTFSPGCQNITTPYISFGSQPNGENDLLILGIQDSSQSAVIQISVTQSVIIGFFFYYYVLIAITGIVAIVIAVGIGIFIYRQRRRTIGGSRHATGEGTSEYNNIDHFQNMMPLFAAERLGTELSICPICLQQIVGAEVVRQTPCHHVFHSTCIDSWGLKNMSCPVCRYDLSLYGVERNLNNAQNRIRNSTIKMDIPLAEEQWSEQVEVPLPQETLQAEQDETPRGPLLDSDKYEIRQNML